MWKYFVLFACCVAFCAGSCPDMPCGPFEDFRCVHPCPPEKTCNNRFIQYLCIEPTEPCEYKCVCIDGYVRTDAGDCMPIEHCDTTCGSYEELRCVHECPPEKTCSTRDIEYPCREPIDPCQYKCVCMQGYVRDDAGECIPSELCDVKCGVNQELRCVYPCPPERTCSTLDLQYRCMAPIDPCQYQCVCTEGHVRNAAGDCIPTEYCDKCQGEHEFYGCGSACDNECTTIGKQNRTHCPVENCNPDGMCYCEDGYARDKYQKCIPVEECDPVCTDKNEMYSDCKKSCPPETCISIIAKFKCDSTEPCKKGCVCKPGFLRKKENTPCVPICECPEMKNAPECQKKPDC